MRSGALVASKYRLIKELGAGGMGSVWQAAHVVTERDFAIKFLHASCASSPSLLARFFQEAKVSGKLRHPSVIEIFDVGTEPALDGAPYLVMELLDGGSLDVLMRQVGPLPPRLVLESMLEVTRALALAHDKGIVHRDLKPANIFLHRPGTGALVPKVLDFGISKFAGTNAPDVSTGLTQTGAVLGSPLYMSPEQAASDKTIDGRSDIHALGVVLWECLVGKAPFSADTYNNLVVQIITGERPRLAEAMPHPPPGVVALVERAMARRREDRYQTAGELAVAIEAAIAALPPGTSIGARTAAAELFGRIAPPSMRPAPGPERPAADASTTGGVAVPSQRMPSNVSPAAFTMPRPSDAQHSTGPAAYAETQEVRTPALAATVPEPAATLPVSTTASRRSVGRIGAIAGAAALALAGVVATVVLRPSSPRVAAPSAATVASAPSIEPIASETPPVPSPAAVPSPSAVASAPPPPPSPHPVHVASGAPAHAAVPAPVAPRPTAPRKPKDSVQSSGF